jgi:sedoheptulokinase
LVERIPDIGCIGLTGQMHGVLYTEQNNQAVSPLYTWQDGRGELIRRGQISYSRYASEITGYKMASGYGILTHFNNIENRLVPDGVRYIVTIADYIAIKLTKAKSPLMHISHAAALGAYDILHEKIDENALRKLEIDPAVVPEISGGYVKIGSYKGRSVFCAIGDNQASFLGSVQNPEKSILINIGTGSQVSVYTNELIHCDSMELRPFMKKDYLLVGSSLCGGYAYSLLEMFYSRVLKMAGVSYTGSLMPHMDKAAEKAYKEGRNPLRVSTKFSGTRENPYIRGSIKNIGIDNFTPEELCLGTLRGIVEELWEYYKAALPFIKGERTTLVGSGNSIKKSSLMTLLLSEAFKLPLFLTKHKEEASYGAALYALIGEGVFEDIKQAQSIIQYKKPDRIGGKP